MALMHRLYGYYYFEKPDYEECAAKTLVCMKMAATWGVGMTTWHLITADAHVTATKPIPKTFEYGVRSFIRYTGPAASIAFLGASITCALAGIRGKKDDPYNHTNGRGLG